MSDTFTKRRRAATAEEFGIELAPAGLFCQVPRAKIRQRAPCGNIAIYLDHGSPICGHHVARRRAHYLALGKLSRNL